MTFSNLQKGNKIESEIRTVERVLEHFKKWESGKTDPLEFVKNYLFECRNVGDDSIRKSLALAFINDSISFLQTKKNMLQEEFDAL